MDVMSSIWPSTTHTHTKTDPHLSCMVVKTHYCRSTTLNLNRKTSQLFLWDIRLHNDRELDQMWCAVKEWHLYLCSFDFVSSSTAPAFEIRQNFTFFSIQTRLHLTPPLLLNYRSWTYTRAVYIEIKKTTQICLYEERIFNRWICD